MTVTEGTELPAGTLKTTKTTTATKEDWDITSNVTDKEASNRDNNKIEDTNKSTTGGATGADNTLKVKFSSQGTTSTKIPIGAMGVTSQILTQLSETDRGKVEANSQLGRKVAFKVVHQNWQPGQMMMYMALKDHHPRILVLMGSKRDTLLCLEVTVSWMRFVHLHLDALRRTETTSPPRESDLKRFKNKIPNADKEPKVTVPKLIPVNHTEAAHILATTVLVYVMYTEEKDSSAEQKFSDPLMYWMLMASVRGNDGGSTSILSVSLVLCHDLPTDDFLHTLAEIWGDPNIQGLDNAMCKANLKFPKGPTKTREGMEKAIAVDELQQNCSQSPEDTVKFSY